MQTCRPKSREGRDRVNPRHDPCPRFPTLFGRHLNQRPGVLPSGRAYPLSRGDAILFEHRLTASDEGALTEVQEAFAIYFNYRFRAPTPQNSVCFTNNILPSRIDCVNRTAERQHHARSLRLGPIINLKSSPFSVYSLN